MSRSARQGNRKASAGCRRAAWGSRLVVLGSALAAVLQATAQDSVPGARDRAPVDLTGQWVSVISEDWAWRMRTPPHGDYASIPLNEAGIAAADRWTTDQDGSCLAFGAAAALRVPTRVRIEWADEQTLQIETDNGTQIRWLHFAPEPVDPTARSLQGHTRARWVTVDSVTASGATGGILTSELDSQPWASLEAVTTNMSAAWLRPNGVPYSADATMTEYFDAFEDGDDRWFAVTTMIEDPAFLTEPFVVSSNFRRETDTSGWNPEPCRNSE